MRKGKWFVSVMLAAVCCFVTLSFTACGDDDKTTPEGEKVADEAAWRTAFDYSEITNYEYNMNVVATAVESSAVLSEIHCAEARDGYKVKEVEEEYYNGVADDENGTWYYLYAPDEKWDSNLADGAPNNGTEYYYFYDEESSAWYYRKHSLYDDDLEAKPWDDFDSYLSEYENSQDLLSNRYNEFRYDEERGLYVLTIDELVEEYPDNTTSITKDIEVTVCIQKGKVVKGTIKALRKGDSGEPDSMEKWTFAMSKIGECTVTIPTAEPAPNN